MSAALQLPVLWCAGAEPDSDRKGCRPPAGANRPQPGLRSTPQANARTDSSLAFYRRHTEKLLRRYLYASLQVGRAPSILGDPVARGWVSSRPVRTFEDAVIFVLDVESCLNQLDPLDQQIVCRIVLQDYTQSEVAAMLSMSLRSLSTRFLAALDRLTGRLLESKVLVLPE